MAHLIKAPNKPATDTYHSIFLAGGITGCEDWQHYVWERLMTIPYLNVFSPRRDNFDINNKNITKEQIAWEYEWLQKSDSILFWFSHETIQPIVLLEFGRWTALDKKLFVGCSPKYPRIQDVEIQLSLIRPEQKLHYSLNELIRETRNYYNDSVCRAV